MGDMSEMLLDGTLCEDCGVLLDGKSPGYPRSCDDCADLIIAQLIAKRIERKIALKKCNGGNRRYKS